MKEKEEIEPEEESESTTRRTRRILFEGNIASANVSIACGDGQYILTVGGYRTYYGSMLSLMQGLKEILVRDRLMAGKKVHTELRTMIAEIKETQMQIWQEIKKSLNGIEEAEKCMNL